jgi:hypothetical protein
MPFSTIGAFTCANGASRSNPSKTDLSREGGDGHTRHWQDMKGGEWCQGDQPMAQQSSRKQGQTIRGHSTASQIDADSALCGPVAYGGNGLGKGQGFARF